jgi:hypothetical protein
MTHAERPAPDEPDKGGALARYVREYMRARNILPNHVSRGIGIHPAPVARFSKGERSLLLDTFDGVCTYLGLRLTDGADEGRMRRILEGIAEDYRRGDRRVRRDRFEAICECLGLDLTEGPDEERH